jgi:diadenosine tetraphosphate (Ap4A) HIT family hydrolase
MTSCCLCSNLSSSSPDRPWNKPLFESANFVSLPSLGSLVEGWLLVVPKNHFLSMGALSNDLANELDLLKAEIGSVLERRYGHLCIFEHGPSLPNSHIGCSVDHAHLHLVPIDFDLFEAVAPYLPPGTKWSTATWEDCRAAHHRGKDYLYLEQPIGNGRIAVHSAFGSQLFRKAIAARLGVPKQFNWREHFHVENIERTIKSLSRRPEGAVSL